jgi:PAS domain-containing protein
MAEHTWVKEFPGAVTVCDPQGIILEMNDAAARSYAADGGEKLIGSNMLDCHPPAARDKLEAIMESRRPNIYTIEKKGVHKLVYQVPWTRDGEYAGFMEILLETPAEMPHFVRG